MQTRKTKEKNTSMDAFIDYLIDQVLFPEEEKADERGTRNTSESTNQNVPLQS